jgi:hypothetical protein
MHKTRIQSMLNHDYSEIKLLQFYFKDYKNEKQKML